MWSHPSINLHDYDKEWFYYSTTHPHNRWICEDRHETNEAFFLRFVKVSKSLPLSEPTFCAPISKPTTPGSWGSLSRPFCGSLTPHTGVTIRGWWGITGYGDDCFLVCLVCESLVAEDEPYSVRVEHSRIVSCFDRGFSLNLLLHVCHRNFNMMDIFEYCSPIQPTWAVMVQWPKSMLGLADVGYKQQ